MADLKMPKINHIQVSGRITKDLEIKYTPKGTAVLRFSIANERSFKNGDQWENETTFINVQAWSGTAELISKQAHKGSAVLIDGRLACSKYEKDGVTKEYWEVIAETVNVLEWLPKGESIPEPEIPPADNEPF